MHEEAIAMAFDEAIEQIESERTAIESKITGRAGGFGF
jgi:hypothetical protein